LIEEDTSQTLDFFENDWGWRPKDSTDAEILTQIRNRSETIARLPSAYAAFETLRQAWPGRYAVTATSCFYVAADAMPNLNSDGFCGGTISFQSRDRVCSVMTYWYSGKINTVFSVDQVQGNDLHHLGHCDWNGAGPSCPGEGSAPEDHWDNTISPDVEGLWRDLTQPQGGRAGGNDPEAWAALDVGDWFQTCLTSADYPPPALTWAGTGPKP